MEIGTQVDRNGVTDIGRKVPKHDTYDGNRK